MNAVLATAALAPIQREPSIRAEQVSQLVLGEPALVRSSSGDWREIETLVDRYPGWIHRGYLRELSRDDADAWLAGAAWSDGAEIDTGGSRIALPLRARVQRIEDVVQLPDGRDGTVSQGLVADLQFVRESARRVRPDQWAIRKFTGAPYLWGGVTPWGVDCSGLIQSTWLARGITLPRDASVQAKEGSEVSREEIAPGDLLFFADGDTPGQITHVGIAGDRDSLVHATLRRGGFVVERRIDLEGLMQKLVVIRRLSF
jgi:cell wall-associated NlpC family hydrolase